MKIFDEIKRRLNYRRGQIISDGSVVSNFSLCRYDFALLVWSNICGLLFDLLEDTSISSSRELSPLSDEGYKFAAFKAFVYVHGRLVLQRLYNDGFVVIGYHEMAKRFDILTDKQYTIVGDFEKVIAEPMDKCYDVYVMRDDSFATFGKSKKSLCRAWLDYLDDTLNASATSAKHLGAVVVASPKNLNNAPTAIVLDKEQKDNIEKELRENYGALSHQSNIMILPREMSWQTINLAGMDVRLSERVRMAILAICDCVRVPANQVAIIDAQQSKALANGGEIREGDKLKYKAFRRLFERSFSDMARYYRVPIDYAIDGEPIGENLEVIA